MPSHTEPGTLERTIALSEIHFTLGSYAVRARESTTLEEKLENITATGHITSPDGTRMPFKDFFEMIEPMHGPYLRHDVTSVQVSFLSDGRAETVSQLIARTDQSQKDHWGEWKNVLVRADNGRWLIEEQVNVVDGFDPNGFYGQMFASKGEEQK